MTKDRGPVFDGVRIGRPATGALIDAGYASLADLPADLDALAPLHGVGPKALRLLGAARDPARRREDVTEVELVGGVEERELFLAPHDPAWAREYAVHQVRVRDAVPVALAIEHIGSTSVPGLAAKPIIDILVTVPDITAEEDYLDPLVAAGYPLRVREPGHRMVRTEQRDVHIHILEADVPAADAYLLLRDHLRVDRADRELYERTKRELLSRDWPDMNAYADAKTAVITEIKERALAAQREPRSG